MAKTLEEFLQELNQGNAVGVSKYNIRNEKSQTMSRVKKYKMLKKEDKKRAKLCVIKEIAVPFNITTGQKDEIYNEDNKFRPTGSVQSTIKLIKQVVNKYQAAKDTFMRYAGVKEWDTSNEEVVTKKDMDVMRPYIVPRIFTVRVVHLDIPAMRTGKFGRDYKINVEIDPETGKIMGELPFVLKAHRFFNAIAYEKIAEYNDKIEKGIEKATEEDKKKFFQGVYEKFPISDYHPSNYAMMVELGLTATCEPTSETSKVIRTATAGDIQNLISIASYAAKPDKGYRAVIEAYLRKEYPKNDVHNGYWEVDMRCPMESTNPGQRGLDTKFEKPDYLVGEPSAEEYEKDPNAKIDFEQFDNAVAEYLDNVEELERIILNSINTYTYNEQVEAALIMALPTVIDLEDPYITNSVILNNRDFISIVYGEEGDKLIEEAEEELNNKSQGSYNEEKAAKASKEYDVSELEESDEVDALELGELEGIE